MIIDAGEVLERFRRPIELALREVVGLQSSPIYELLRFHLGLDGSSQPGGKALRPTLCLLVCEALGGDWPAAMPAAISLELIHNFSLIHDDIQDGDRERHHRPTVWARWGVPQAINAGDAMYCLSTLHLRELRPRFEDRVVVEATTILQDATREMIEGQYLDVDYEQVPEVGLDDYLRMISCKTGALLRASIELGALLAGCDEQVRRRSREFGEAMGRLFQIRDDMLGVWGLSETTGKPVGADVKRKKKSLPIVMALSTANPERRDALLSIYQQDELTDAEVDRVQTIFTQLEVESGARALADEAHQRALALAKDINFSDSGRADILNVLTFLLERDH